jgi:hypothetical protein
MAKKPPAEKPRETPALDEAELDAVTGGQGATHAIVSPRDPASGLATGKRI